MTVGDVNKKPMKTGTTNEIVVKNKYNGEVIATLPADTRETLREKIKRIHEFQATLAQSDKFERVAWLGKVARKVRFRKKELKNIEKPWQRNLLLPAQVNQVHLITLLERNKS